MFRNLATRVIHLIISARIEQMPDEPRRRYFRNMAWFCVVLALSEALFAFLILWGWFTIVWVAPVLPAIWLVSVLSCFFWWRLLLLLSRVWRGGGVRPESKQVFACRSVNRS